MRDHSLSKRTRALGLAVVAGVLSLRPIISAEVNTTMAALADVTLIGAAYLSLLVSGPRRTGPLRGLFAPLAMWYVALLIGVAARGASTNSLGDRLALAGGPLVLCAASTSWGPWRARVTEGVFLVAASIALFAIWQSLVLLPELAAHSADAPASSMGAVIHEVAARGRVLGSFALPILLAAYLSCVIPLALFALVRSRSAPLVARVGLWSTLLLTSVAWLLTHSVGAWCALVAACAIVWLKRGILRRWLVLGTVVLVLCGGLILSGRGDLWNYASPHHPIHNRIIYWDAALHLITSHPIRGVGPGQFARAYREVTIAPQLTVRHAHNTYLQIWAEWGLLAIVSWCWLLMAILRKTAILSPWLAVAILVLPIDALFNFSFYVPQVSMLWWYLAGWGLRQRASCPSPSRQYVS